MPSPVTFQKIDKRRRVPKYLQARESLIASIRSGQFPPGSKLPATAAISEIFNISLITAHRALEGLVETGWLRREVGRGTYVCDHLESFQDAPRPLSIGLLFHRHVNIDDYYHSTLINGLRLAARGSDRRVDFFFGERFELQSRPDKDVCAICIHPPLETQSQVERLAGVVPTVVLGGSFPQSRVPCVDCDNRGGTRAAVRQLLDLGHTRYLVLSGPINHSNARDRLIGAQDELSDNGIALGRQDRPVSGDAVVLDDRTRQRVLERLAAPDRPTAVVAGGFYLALWVFRLARQVGLRIPEELSVVGFDDPPSAALLDPPLTTLRQPLVKMAAAAYRLLARAAGRPLEARRSRVLATELLIRGSIAPAPSLQ